MKAKQISLYTAMVVLGGSVAVSCTKLDQKVYSVAQAENFWQTPEQVAAGLAPAYQALTNIPDGDVDQLNDISGGAVIVPTRGNDWYDNGSWQAIWTHNWKADLGNINGAWSAIFNGIGKANFTLSVVNALSTKPANIDAINAELKVLRAYYYYLAMDMFGQVPIVTDFNTDPSTVKNDKSRSEIFNFIESELKANIDALPTDVNAATYGRLTKWAGYMILAKLYLNAQVYTGTPRWADCIAACDVVINSGKYSLSSNYFDNFIVKNDNSTENIFVVPFDKVYIGNMNWEMQTLHYQHNLKYNLSGQPWNGFCSTADYYDQFDDADRRKQMFLVGQQFDAQGNPIKDAQTGLPLKISKYVNELSNPADSFRLAGARNVKYQPEAGTAGNQSNDMVLFRLADAYLMKAEAELRSSTNLSDAVSNVNLIRERAYGDATHDWTLADLTLENLYHERSREMAWEGWARQDAIRFGHFGDARFPGKNADADAHLQIFPIPAPQISSNPNLQQNPGY
ncbi:MAG TPA: RagB/SusD family nutrient uptake outer membrane protein [Chitinophagaceae bacterium]|nr:RagB/SusD family nutrient uptake outer membrane protein [Chitinophagaceae bacterium]